MLKPFIFIKLASTATWKPLDPVYHNALWLSYSPLYLVLKGGTVLPRNCILWFLFKRICVYNVSFYFVTVNLCMSLYTDLNENTSLNKGVNNNYWFASPQHGTSSQASQQPHWLQKQLWSSRCFMSITSDWMFEGHIKPSVWRFSRIMIQRSRKSTKEWNIKNVSDYAERSSLFIVNTALTSDANEY